MCALCASSQHTAQPTHITINELYNIFQLDRYEQKVLKRENSISISYKTKVARMLFIVVIIFIILHIPFTALIFIRNQLLKSLVMDQIDGWFYILWYTSHYLLYLNAAVNPIIYGLTNDNFRRAYHQTPLLPQRIRHWSMQTKKMRNRHHNEVRIDVLWRQFTTTTAHTCSHSFCVWPIERTKVFYCNVILFSSLPLAITRTGDWFICRLSMYMKLMDIQLCADQHNCH